MGRIDGGKRLVANDYILIEPNGESANVFSFGYGTFALFALPDFHGGAVGLYSSGGGYNRSARILTLMAILLTGGIASGGVRSARRNRRMI